MVLLVYSFGVKDPFECSPSLHRIGFRDIAAVDIRTLKGQRHMYLHRHFLLRYLLAYLDTYLDLLSQKHPALGIKLLNLPRFYGDK